MAGKSREIQVRFLNKQTVFHSVRWGLGRWIGSMAGKPREIQVRFLKYAYIQYISNFTQLVRWGVGLAQCLVNPKI